MLEPFDDYYENVNLGVDEDWIFLNENDIFMEYPDGQRHINLNHKKFKNSQANVVCSLTDTNKIFDLLLCSDALDNLNCVKNNLYIPYLMGARFDRIMQPGDSFDLKVISKIINSCGFKRVFLLDVHSDVSTALINNSTNITNQYLVDKIQIPNTLLICPDAGASKKIPYYLSNKNITDVVYCNKSRNLSTGEISLSVLEPEKCKGRDCVIIDDICDGGGTFISIAKQIKPSSLCLVVTHGIFSKGFDVLNKYFDCYITTDSYPSKFTTKQRLNIISSQTIMIGKI